MRKVASTMELKQTLEDVDEIFYSNLIILRTEGFNKKVGVERERLEQNDEYYFYEFDSTNSEKDELKRLCWAQRESHGGNYDYNEKRIESIIMSWRNGNLERFAKIVIELLDDSIIARKILQYVGTYQETDDGNDFLTACYSMWGTSFDELYNKISERKIKNHETLAWLWKIGYTHHHRLNPDYIVDWSDPKTYDETETSYLYDCFDRLKNPDIEIYLALFDNIKILYIIGCIKYNHIFFRGVS